MTANVIEAQVSAPKARQFFFRPLGRSLRGEWDFTNATTPKQLQLKQRWPHTVPGVVVGVDLKTGRKYIREPLHDGEHAAARMRVERFGLTPPEQFEEIESESIVTWLYWIKKGVDAGLLKLVSGSIPPLDEFDEEPKTSFIITQDKSRGESLTDAVKAQTKAIEAQTKVMEALLAKLAK